MSGIVMVMSGFILVIFGLLMVMSRFVMSDVVFVCNLVMMSTGCLCYDAVNSVIIGIGIIVSVMAWSMTIWS